MMKNKITPLQLFYILLQVQIGLGIFWVDKKLFQTTKNDSWITIVLAGLATQVMITIIWHLTKKYTFDNSIDLLKQIFGRSLGTITGYIYTFYFITVQVLILFMLAKILQQWVLPETPILALLLISVLALLYTAGFTIQSHVYFYSLMSIVITICFLFFIPAFQHVDIRYLFPILNTVNINLLKGVATVFIIFSGFETLLFYIGYVKDHKDTKIYKSATWANVVITIFYTLVVFLITTSFSPNALKNTPQPIIAMLKGYQYGMVNRYDDLFLGFWLLLIIASMMNYAFLATQNMYFLTRKSHTTFKLASFNACIIFVGAVCINNITRTTLYINIFWWLCLGVSIVIPCCLAIKSSFHKRSFDHD